MNRAGKRYRDFEAQVIRLGAPQLAVSWIFQLEIVEDLFVLLYYLLVDRVHVREQLNQFLHFVGVYEDNLVFKRVKHVPVWYDVLQNNFSDLLYFCTNVHAVNELVLLQLYVHLRDVP